MTTRGKQIFPSLSMAVAVSAAAILAVAGKDRIKTDADVRVDSIALQRHVEFLAGMDPPRTGSAPLSRAAKYIESEFHKGSGRVSRQPFDVHGEQYYNIVAAFGPRSGTKLVVGAHYDSAFGNPGADDNASGVAGLIELSRLLDDSSFREQLEIVAFALEEPPYFRSSGMGSAVHAHSGARRGERVSLMISLEMIGFYSDEPGSQHYPFKLMRLVYPDRGDFVAVVGRLRDFSAVQKVKRLMSASSRLPVRSLCAPAFVPGIDFSDHLSYWNAGYDAVMVTDTAFYRNRRYHTEDDLPDTLDYERMAEVVEGVLHTVEELAR